MNNIEATRVKKWPMYVMLLCAGFLMSVWGTMAKLWAEQPERTFKDSLQVQTKRRKK